MRSIKEWTILKERILTFRRFKPLWASCRARLIRIISSQFHLSSHLILRGCECSHYRIKMGICLLSRPEDLLQVGCCLVSLGSRLVTLMHSQQHYLWKSSKQLKKQAFIIPDDFISIQMILQSDLIRSSWAAGWLSPCISLVSDHTGYHGLWSSTGFLQTLSLQLLLPSFYNSPFTRFTHPPIPIN